MKCLVYSEVRWMTFLYKMSQDNMSLPALEQIIAEISKLSCSDGNGYCQDTGTWYSLGISFLPCCL